MRHLKFALSAASAAFLLVNCTRPEAAGPAASETPVPPAGTTQQEQSPARNQGDDVKNNQNQAVAEKKVPAAAPMSTGTMTIGLAGGASVTWIQDNEGEKLNPRSLFSDASDELYDSLNLPRGIPASVSAFLLQAEGEYILFDAGLGSFGGSLHRRLEKLGIQASAVKFIYLTHFHADHIAGLIAKGSPGGGEVKAFPDAEIYAGRAEYDAWMNHIDNNDLQKKIMGMYQAKLHLFDFGDTLPHGVRAMDAAGHTPGHTAFQYKNLLVIGDLIHGYALQKDHPEINSNYDMDKAKSAESRKRILEYARQNDLIMAGMHLPPPGFMK